MHHMCFMYGYTPPSRHWITPMYQTPTLDQCIADDNKFGILQNNFCRGQTSSIVKNKLSEQANGLHQCPNLYSDIPGHYILLVLHIPLTITYFSIDKNVIINSYLFTKLLH